MDKRGFDVHLFVSLSCDTHTTSDPCPKNVLLKHCSYQTNMTFLKVLLSLLFLALHGGRSGYIFFSYLQYYIDQVLKHLSEVSRRQVPFTG